VLAAVIIIGGLFMTFQEKNVAGLTAIISTLTALVGVFVYGKRDQRKELARKRSAPQEPTKDTVSGKKMECERFVRPRNKGRVAVRCKRLAFTTV